MLTQTYNYDGVNRLQSITETGGATNWNRVYSYDEFGNRAATGQNVFANTPQNLAAFDAATNRLTGDFAGYDAAGNQTAFTVAGFKATLDYDANNLQRYYCAGVTATCNATNATAEYQYDGDGRRVKKVQGARTTVFVYDAFGNLAAEYDTQPAPNLMAGAYYRTTDHLGSTRLVTNATGGVVSRRDFFPFGEEIPANASFGNRQMVMDGGTTTTYNKEFGVHQKFTGKERDTESGLDYFGSRYLSASLGRFTSPDEPLLDQTPQGPQSWNLYNHVRNNPIKNIDPDGRICVFGFGDTCDQKEQVPPPPPPQPPKPPAGAPGSPTYPLIVAQDQARTKESNQPEPGGRTFCNFAVCQTAEEVDAPMGRLLTGLQLRVGPGVRNALANEMVQNLPKSAEFREVTPDEAQKLANEGKLVIAARFAPGHGHVVTVRPDNSYFEQGACCRLGTGSLINNIGRRVGISRASDVFKSGPPRYYTPN